MAPPRRRRPRRDAGALPGSTRHRRQARSAAPRALRCPVRQEPRGPRRAGGPEPAEVGSRPRRTAGTGEPGPLRARSGAAGGVPADADVAILASRLTTHVVAAGVGAARVPVTVGPARVVFLAVAVERRSPRADDRRAGHLGPLALDIQGEHAAVAGHALSALRALGGALGRAAHTVPPGVAVAGELADTVQAGRAVLRSAVLAPDARKGQRAPHAEMRARLACGVAVAQTRAEPLGEATAEAAAAVAALPTRRGRPGVWAERSARPLPDVAGHVAQAERARRVLADLTAVATLPAELVVGGLVVSPGVRPVFVSAARRKLPLELRRQPRAAPRAVRRCLVPVDAVHGVVGAVGVTSVAGS